MAKKVDPLKAKQAKQKKIAIGLCALLALVVAFQGPKTLKMFKGPGGAVAATDGSDPTALPAGVEAIAPAATAIPPTAASAGAPAVAATTVGAPATATGSQPAVLANSDVPVTAGEGQLLSFEQFASKDPFQQQVDVKAAVGAAAAAAAGDEPTVSGSDPVSPGSDPSIPGSAENPPLSVGGIGSDPGAGTSSSSGSSSSGSSGSASAPTNPGPAPAAGTTISVNGIASTVTAGTPFPADQPTFSLVSVAKDGKSVQIGVAGGSLAGGGATVKLTVGKPVTLQNTADGTRYKLVLLSVEGATPPSKG